MGKRIKRISDAIFRADQSKIDQWFIRLDMETALAKRHNKVKQKVFEALNEGVEPSKIAEITGIPVATVYTWLKKAKKKDYIQEAKELKASMEQPHATH